MNCLKSTGHQAKQCGSGSCRKCGKLHNTLLHYEQPNNNKISSSLDEMSSMKTEPELTTVSNHVCIKKTKEVLLATAIVNIKDSKGNNKACRALLDSGSQSCVITSECAQRLELRLVSINVPICGLGETNIYARKQVEVQLSSRVTAYKADLNCLVVRQITQAMPAAQVNICEFKIPKGIRLVDNSFHKASQVDMLIGAEIFFDLLHTCNRF